MRHGPDVERADAALLRVLSSASTASITTMLGRRGVHSVWMPLKPLFSGMRVVGPALTLRSLPGREDLQEDTYTVNARYPIHAFDAYEAMQPGDVLVHDGLGITDMGLFGDLMTLAVKEAGGAGLVTDMAVRDSAHMAEKELSIFCRGVASPGGRVLNVDYNVPIACAGVAVFPGDIIVGDDDGVVVIPQQMLTDVVADILEREERDAFIRLRLAEGRPLRGLYPMDDDTLVEFRQWLADGRPGL